MSVTVEIRVIVRCDDCRSVRDHNGDRVTVLRNLRMQGWKIGKKDLCPTCRIKTP